MVLYPLYKARFLNKRISDDRQYAVFTAYIAERELLISYFGDKATDDMGAFRNGRSQIFVGSMISWAEGVDLAWMNGAIVLYSLAWSGATYLQILDRMNNKLRRDKILIHVLCLAGGVGEKVYSAVSKKKNFNSKVLQGCDMKESDLQSKIRGKIAACGGWSANVMAASDDGIPDILGFKPRIITADDIGKTTAVFFAAEVKHPSGNGHRRPLQKYQINKIRKKSGSAAFFDNIDDFNNFIEGLK